MSKCERCNKPIDPKVSWCAEVNCLTERVEQTVNQQFKRRNGKEHE
jgi:hypothetical protein